MNEINALKCLKCIVYSCCLHLCSSDGGCSCDCSEDDMEKQQNEHYIHRKKAHTNLQGSLCNGGHFILSNPPNYENINEAKKALLWRFMTMLLIGAGITCLCAFIITTNTKTTFVDNIIIISGYIILLTILLFSAHMMMHHPREITKTVMAHNIWAEKWIIIFNTVIWSSGIIFSMVLLLYVIQKILITPTEVFNIMEYGFILFPSGIMLLWIFGLICEACCWGNLNQPLSQFVNGWCRKKCLCYLPTYLHSHLHSHNLHIPSTYGAIGSPQTVPQSYTILRN